MRVLFAGVLLALAFSQANAANITATTGWNHINSAECDVTSPTIDSGSNRKFVVHISYETGTDPAPTITVGGQSPSGTATSSSTTPTNDTWHYIYEWNESTIGSMSGTDIVHSDSVGAFQLGCSYGTIENTDQTAISAVTGSTVGTTGTTDTVTTTSSSGDLITVSSVLAAAQGPHTGWDTLTELHDSNGGDGWYYGFAAGNGGDTPTTVTWTSDNANGYHIVSVVYPNAAAALEFSAGPTRAAATNGHTITGTLNNIDTSATVYGAAYLPGVSAPADCDAVQAASGALYSASDATWAEDVSDTLTLTEANNVPYQDVYVCAEDSGMNQTAVTSFTDVARSADTNQTIVRFTSALSSTAVFSVKTVANCDTDGSTALLTGCGAMGWLSEGMLVDLSAGFADLTDVVVECAAASNGGCASDEILLENVSNSMQTNITVTQNTYYNPAVVGSSGDAVEHDDTVTCDAGSDSVTVGADGEISYTATTCGSTYTQLDYSIQDYSTTSNEGAFTNPSTNSTDDTIYFFNSRPQMTLSDQSFVLAYNTAMTAVDLTDYCTDPEADTLTFTIRSGTLPTGTSLSGTGNKDWTGTPTVENEAGATVNITCNDPGDLYYEDDLLVYVVDTWTVGSDYTGVSLATALTRVIEDAPWRADDNPYSTPGCNPSGNVVSHTPAAATEATAFQEIQFTLDSGVVCAVTGVRGARLRGVAIGL